MYTCINVISRKLQLTTSSRVTPCGGQRHTVGYVDLQSRHSWWIHATNPNLLLCNFVLWKSSVNPPLGRYRVTLTHHWLKNKEKEKHVPYVNTVSGTTYGTCEKKTRCVETVLTQVHVYRQRLHTLYYGSTRHGCSWTRAGRLGWCQNSGYNHRGDVHVVSPHRLHGLSGWLYMYKCTCTCTCSCILCISYIN